MKAEPLCLPNRADVNVAILSLLKGVPGVPVQQKCRPGTEETASGVRRPATRVPVSLYCLTSGTFLKLSIFYPHLRAFFFIA